MLNMTNALKRALLVAGIGVVGMIGNANADVLITATSGNLAASADFSVVGGNLQVVLTNTSSHDVLVPADVLMAVFFDLNGVGGLTPVSASIGGSTVFYGSLGAGGVGAGWNYKSGLSGLPGGASEGISAAGYSSPSFGPSGAFGCGANCVMVNGLDYGLLSAGDNTATGNTGVTGHGPLILDAVTFTLSGLPAGFTDADLSLSNVAFQYGTTLANQPGGEPCIGSCGPATTPEPTMPLLIGAALFAWGATRRLARRA